MKIRLTFILLCILSVSLSGQYDDMRFKPENKAKEIEPVCKLVFDGYDDQLLVNKKEFAAEKLLGYTQPSILKMAPDLELIEIYVANSLIDGYYFMDLQVIFHTPQAKANYGGITKNSNLKIRFLNDEYIYLNSLKTDLGSLSKDGTKTIFKSSYQLNEYEIKMLKRYYLDELEIVWRFGLEKYPIENINLFKQQLACLEGKK